MPCSCNSPLNWRDCEHDATRRCFVCDAALCDACARPVLTSEGWVVICGCGARLCAHALQVASARAAV